MSECEHKWKIIKKFKVKTKPIMGMMGKETTDTCYHLQCEKCGDLKSRVAVGWDEEEKS